MATRMNNTAKTLDDAPPGCCPLCKSQLSTQGILHTPDFSILVRDGVVTTQTMIEAAILRELFAMATKGFQIHRSTLIDRIYNGVKEPPINADNVISVAITSLRHKLLPLGMGIMSRNGVVTAMFVPPGYKRVR